MEQPRPDDPAGLDVDALTPAVQQALRSDSAVVSGWSASPLRSDDVHFGGGKLFLVSGTALDLGSTRSWSMVLKPVGRVDEDRAMQASELVDDYAYWKREPLAYASGILDELPGGVVAPACYGVAERSADLYWIWLERVSSNRRWPVDRYRTAARHLGAFNGTYMSGMPGPAVKWAASSRSVQSYWGRSHPLMAGAIELLENPAMWRHEEIRRRVDSLDLASLAAFFAEQDRFVGLLERSPQTFCHNDALRPNLLAPAGSAGAKRTIAIDWQLAGQGPIGSELAMLVAGSVLFFKVAAADIERLAALAWAGYLEGLHDVGVEAHEDVVRIGYAASAAARCGLLAVAWLRNALEDPDWVERVWSRPAAVVVGQTALLASYLDQRAAEARRLLGEI